jgi:hypothetical protein
VGRHYLVISMVVMEPRETGKKPKEKERPLLCESLISRSEFAGWRYIGGAANTYRGRVVAPRSALTDP